jgi:hypothetical protein
MRKLLACAAICVCAVLLVLTASSPVAEVSAERFVSGDNAPRLSNYDVREHDPAKLDEVVRLTAGEDSTDDSKRLLKQIQKAASEFPIRNQAGKVELNETTGVAETTDMGGICGMRLGIGASVINAGTGTNNTRVVESFGLPNVIVTDPFTVSDGVGNNNGYPETGENLLITITSTNATGITISCRGSSDLSALC